MSEGIAIFKTKDGYLVRPVAWVSVVNEPEKLRCFSSVGDLVSHLRTWLPAIEVDEPAERS